MPTKMAEQRLRDNYDNSEELAMTHTEHISKPISPEASSHLPALSSLFNLEGKRAVVSGGSSGIGLAVSHLLASIGMYVEVLDLKDTPKSGDSVIDSRISTHRLDVTNRDKCHLLAQSIIENYGRITTLINAAGIVLPDEEAGPSSRLLALLDCNVLGTAHLCEAFRDNFHKEMGTIVNIGSIVGTFGWSKRAAYCASKGALEAMSRALALEYAPLNIRVNVVAPGIVATPLMKSIIMSQPDPYRAFQERAFQQINRRLITPQEVAQSVLYLASDLSSGVIGATIDLSAGRLAGYVPSPVVRTLEHAEDDREWLGFSAGDAQ